MGTAGLVGVMEADGMAKLVCNGKQFLAGRQAVEVRVDLNANTGATVGSRQISPGDPVSAFKAHEYPCINTGRTGDDRHAQAGAIHGVPVIYSTLYGCSPGSRH